MGNSLPTERRRGGRRTALMDGLTRMMSTSLVVYVVAVAVQRTWAVLNLDVVQLIRRP
jgi:hypothetical protein